MNHSTGVILSAPSSGAGKTTVTLGLLHALSRNGIQVRGAKSGPDYIDPRFHEAACGVPCLNLDAWAMSAERVKALAAGDGLLLIEGAMGLFDGAPPNGKGATADLARQLNLPVVLIVDAARTAQSVAPLVNGFTSYDPDVKIAAVILNNVGSTRHETMLRHALAPLGIPILGAIHRQNDLSHPSRHLGLVQAQEREDLSGYLGRAADTVATAVDLEALIALTAPVANAVTKNWFPPPAQRIAIARDAAFAFAYPHLLNDWKAAGAEISFFSPLADEAPQNSDLIFLPGGYPELYAGQLAAASVFKSGMQNSTQSGTLIYGECGGYMTLGDGLIDAAGHHHEMLGLLRLETSFEKRKLHLGYRTLTAKTGPFVGRFTAHEFHYATTLNAEGTPLFHARDAEGNDLGKIGLMAPNVSGSFAHMIDRR